ncbi:MAG: histidine kinase dimerization/phospho-acceptor domain-containing protein, partial [Anaerolineae bacterium]
MSDRPIKVLLVEDNPGDARLIREALAEAGTARFKLAHIEHLREGLQRLAEGGIDVVLLDLSLPDGQGLDTFTRMHAAKPDIPIVVLTGLDDETLAVKAVRGGAQDYLVKGEVNGKMLSRVLRYAIERKRMHELEAANAALNEGNRAKSRFLATISHELLTPLTAIIGFSELLQDQDFGPLKEKQAEYFNIILTKSRHLLALINDVLDFTKVEAGKLELHPDAFHLPEVVAAALAGIRHQAEAKGLQLEL